MDFVETLASIMRKLLIPLLAVSAICLLGFLAMILQGREVDL
jgi:hypothetical protein